MTAMLNNLKWETLETRRNNPRLTMFYRMQHNMASISPADYLVPVQLKQKIRSRPDVSSAVCPDRRLQILFLPGNCGIRNIRSQDYSFPGTFVPMMELSFSGPFVPWNIRSLDHSFLGTFVPWNFRSRYPGPFLPRTVRAFVS